MPGLTNRRNAIREGTDWTKSKTKGYKTGGKVKIGTGHGYMETISAPITKASKSPLKKTRKKS
tara:strand:- start:523 stop:711 length:189 start_codon:yes stop_codon:yes gene_type:complete